MLPAPKSGKAPRRPREGPAHFQRSAGPCTPTACSSKRQPVFTRVSNLIN